MCMHDKHGQGPYPELARVARPSVRVHAVRIYNKSLHLDQKPLQHLTLEQGQLTWFSPNWYQTVCADVMHTALDAKARAGGQ